MQRPKRARILAVGIRLGQVGLAHVLDQHASASEHHHGGLLLAALERMTKHASARMLVLAVTHEAAAQINTLIANVRTGLNQIRSAAPQLDKAQRWLAALRYIVNQMLAHQVPRGSPPSAAPAA